MMLKKLKKLIESYVQQINSNQENTVEDTFTIDSKWHTKFFMHNRELLQDLQRQTGGNVLIKFPERNTQNNQVQLRGPKESIEQVKKRFVTLIDQWENTVTARPERTSKPKVQG